MAKKNLIEEVLESKGFTEDEKVVFREMISFAKICQKGSEEALKNLIDNKMKGLLNK